ncbi:MAG TPA: hypothetical protein VMU77_03865, partial [Acidimicrobiales bacterium]|nr:hypothetical protein [Acidimicrobiales bacterium]
LVSKKPSNDLVASAIEQLRSLSELPEPGSFTIVVGHGQIDALGFGSPSDGPMQDSGRLSLSVIEEAISQGFCHYVALGDRHSTTQLGTGPIGAASKIWYSGALLATNFDEVEVESNCALVVDIADDGAVCVEQVEVGKWSFIAEHRSISSSEDIELLGEWLGSLEDKSRTAIKLALIGTVNMSGRARLNEILEYHRDLFASLEESERRTDLVVLADDADLGDLGLTGFARSALDELCEMAVNETSGADKPDHSVATDALMLLHRLARSAS